MLESPPSRAREGVEGGQRWIQETPVKVRVLRKGDLKRRGEFNFREWPRYCWKECWTKMAQNGPNDHLGQNGLIPNRILAFGRPKWTILVRFGPFRSANRTLPLPFLTVRCMFRSSWSQELNTHPSLTQPPLLEGGKGGEEGGRTGKEGRGEGKKG